MKKIDRKNKKVFYTQRLVAANPNLTWEQLTETIDYMNIEKWNFHLVKHLDSVELLNIVENDEKV